MKKFYIFCLLSCSLLYFGCKNENEPEPEETRTLVDKPGYVFLDNGEYVEANTEFTDEEAITILKSNIWKHDPYPYIYDYTRIVKVYGGTRDIYWYKFLDNGIYKSTFFGSNLDDAPDFEYSVKNKILTLRSVYRDVFGEIYSESTTKQTLVAVDDDRIIFDVDNINSVWLPKDFPEFDENISKVRSVLNAYKE